MRIDKYRKLPIFIKSQEIFDLAEAIAEGLKESDMKEHLKGEIFLQSSLIQVKIAGAEGGGLYSLRMQNAVLIKIAVMDLMNAVSFAEMVNINEEDYVKLMREKVEEFRLLFLDWIRGFNKDYDIPDNWGIRFDTSTPEQEKLEELMFDDDKFDALDDENYDRWNDDEEDGND
jgi:hypothetical protein